MAMDDPFFDIVNSIEIDIECIDDVVDVTTLSISELVSKFDEINESLFDLGQALRPTTKEARDLHSLRSAIYVEIQKRKKH